VVRLVVVEVEEAVEMINWEAWYPSSTNSPSVSGVFVSAGSFCLEVSFGSKDDMNLSRGLNWSSSSLVCFAPSLFPIFSHEKQLNFQVGKRATHQSHENA
jgi:hypothetical protein